MNTHNSNISAWVSSYRDKSFNTIPKNTKASANSNAHKDAINENLKYSTKLSTSFSQLSNFGSEGVNLDSDKEDNYQTKRSENVILNIGNSEKNSNHHYMRTNYYSSNNEINNIDTMSVEEKDPVILVKGQSHGSNYSEKIIGQNQFTEFETSQNSQNNIMNNNSTPNYSSHYNKNYSNSMCYNTQYGPHQNTLANKVILEEEIMEEDSEKENSNNSCENIYDSKFQKESPLLEKDTTKEDNQNERKKKKKGPTLQELIPLNYLSEKEKFYKMNCKYNPQFTYCFDKLKCPYKRPHVL